ncbi:MAG: cellulase family glycosylhydrolase, partial [Flavisolibacter sp.]
MNITKKIFPLLFLFLSVQAKTQGFLKVKDKAIVNGNQQEIILRGMGLGGWMLQEPYMLQINGIANNQQSFKKKIESLVGKEDMNRFYDAWLANNTTKKDIDSMAAWGFNSVRLPMHYNLYTPPVHEEKDSTKNTWKTQGFALTDSLLSWCKANRVYLILDLHAAPGGQGTDIPISDRDTLRPSLWESEANRNKTVALWKELATRYANEPWIGGYDLINEPNWGFQNRNDKNGCEEKSNTELKALLTEITAAIRSVDKKHIIFIEGNCWANNYSGMFPLWDKNMVISFHKYWNNNDQNSVERFVKIREEQNVPIWMGESGENSNAWFTDAISLLERNKIGWAWWPLKKLGSNNPLQIPTTAGYSKLLKYWRGEEKEMTKSEAVSILMDFAKASNIENNIVHYDVIDAMFRQVSSADTRPFNSHIVKEKYILFASNYDWGRSGMAYHDADSGNYWVSTQKRTPWNRGHQYRNDGVDIGTCNDSLTNGYSVGWTEPGEWLQYTLLVPVKGYYTAKVRTKSNSKNAPGTISLLVGDKKLTGDIDLATKEKSSWNTTEVRNILLEGVQTFRVLIVKGE